MKIHLQCGKNFRNGFVNTDTRPQLIQKIPEGQTFCSGSPTNFDHLCEDGKAEIVSYGDRLEALNPQEAKTTIEYWIKKLSPSGIIEVFFVDVGEFALNMLNMPYESSDINYLLFGEPGHDLRMVLDSQTITTLFGQLGFKVKTAQKVTPFLIKMAFVRNTNE